jgi:hypothetical protein
MYLMVLAEIHGKLSKDNENMEDILTSNVFSFFKYADRGAFFYPLLRLLGLDVSVQDCKQAEFRFWPTYPNHTQPALVILVGRYYLQVDDKYPAGVGKEAAKLKRQLVREITGGQAEAHSLDREFKILFVTSDPYRTPGIFDGIPEDLAKQVKWINWQRIAFLISKILDIASNLPWETRLFASDLYELLLKKKLRNYEGINAIPNIHLSTYQQIFFNAKTARYRGDFIGFIQALEANRLMTEWHTKIFYDQKQSLFQMLNSAKS